MNVSPLVWISFGLTSLTLSVMLACDALVDLVPNHDRQDFEYRRDVAEAPAVQYSALAEHHQLETIKLSMERLAQRNKEIRSLALLLQSGEVLAQIWGPYSHLGAAIRWRIITGISPSPNLCRGSAVGSAPSRTP